MKTEIKLPQYEDVPCWYELFMVNETTIGIRMRVEVFAELNQTLWDTAPIIGHLIEKYNNLENFTPPGSDVWGFDKIFTLVESNDSDWITWKFNLPNIKSEFEDDSSIKTSMAIRATLFIFCLACRFSNTDMLDGGKKQLIILDHICLPEKGRQATGGLSAILTPSSIGWISKQPEGHVNAIRDTMKAAYEHMWNDEKGRNERFGSRIGAPKWIYFDVPGNACDLSPDNNNNPRIEQGYKLVPHNVDGSIQQLALFVGLVKMHDLMRADGF